VSVPARRAAGDGEGWRRGTRARVYGRRAGEKIRVAAVRLWRRWFGDLVFLGGERERERAAVVGEAGGRRRWTFYMWREGEGGRGMTCGARMAASVENGRCSSPRR
jgi:hypothetical protein